MGVSHSWTFDAPSGVYKNHFMSMKLREAAIAETKFMQFTDPEPGYGRKKGESVTITRISNIPEPSDGRINENERIPEDNLTITTTQITVSEWGRSVPYTSLSDDLSEFDISNLVQRKLRDQMRLTMDSAAADAFKAGQIKAVADGVGSIAFSTNGVAAATASANLNVFHVERIRDYMHATLNIPAFSGDDYVALVSTKAKRGIVDDPKWEPWHRYTDPEAKYNSEIGRLENIRFIETNNTSSLSGAIGSGGIAGEAVFFGADAVSMAIAEDPELRAKVPEDYGRQRGVAWYGILEFGQVWGDSANPGEARVVHFTSL
jgi:N4-gp56 family major capsid protein